MVDGVDADRLQVHEPGEVRRGGGDAPASCAREEGVDIVLNLTTSGGEYEDQKRLQHLGALLPEMCSFDPNTLNWANSYIFREQPPLPEPARRQEVVKEDVKPEFEVFRHRPSWTPRCTTSTSTSVPGSPHMQFIMGVGGSMPGTAENLAFLVGQLPAGATWSVSGIGKAHMPMMLAGLALGCDGLRVGLEDNILYGKEPETATKIIATNEMLVRAGRRSWPSWPAARLTATARRRTDARRDSGDHQTLPPRRGLSLSADLLRRNRVISSLKYL